MGELDIERYGTFDSSRFNDIELRLYTLIKAGLASKWELETCYTLDEALKLYALYRMDLDIENARYRELEERGNSQ